MAEKRPTIREVARAAGVSVATVSYALRNHEAIPELTRSKVRAAAERLGYRRNPAFAALGALSHRHAANRDGLGLGYLWERMPGGGLGDAQTVIHGMRLAGARLGYRIESFCLDEFPSPQFVLKIIRNRGICGLVIGHLSDPTIVDALQLRQIALVAERQFEHSLPIHCVRAGRFLEGKEVVLRVAAAGYRRILALQFWHQPRRLEDDYARYGGIMAGAMAAAHQYGAHLDVVDQPPWNDLTAWKKILSRHQPDAIIAMTPGALEPIRQSGWPLPPAGPAFAALEVQTPTSHGLTVAGCTPEVGNVAQVAVEWLDQLLRLGQLGVPSQPRAQIIEPHWIDGQTLPRLTAPRRAPSRRR